MVAAARHGQLKATGTRREDGVRFAVATPSDDAALRRLLRENPMRGAISITFEREPNYFLGANLVGGADRTILAYDRDDRVVCMGRCTLREAWINQRLARVGYLAELRLDHSAQSRVDILRGGYRFFRDLHRQDPADYYFTSIASDNHRARRFLERGLPDFPRYEFLTELTTLLISTKRARSEPAELTSATTAELADFFQATAPQPHFSAVWNPHQFAEIGRHHALSGTPGFGVIRHQGRIVAAAALWDQRPFRQTVIRGYSPALAFARPLLNAIAPVTGLPLLPAPGETLSHAFLSPLAVDPNSTSAALLPGLVAAFAAQAARSKINFLTLALPSEDPRLTILLRQFRCRSYLSRLYRVYWPGDPLVTLELGPILPDISLL